MNIILVVFDSLRKDCVGVYGQPPWGMVHTPHWDACAAESLVMTRAFPESLPTLPARRALYTGQRVYPFRNGDVRLKGDTVGEPGWGPIPEEQTTLAEMLREAGYRTGLIGDLYHMFRPSKNFWRGFDQWMFLRGQEGDPARSGPRLTQAEVDYWLPKQLQSDNRVAGLQKHMTNFRDRTKEEDYFAPRVFKEAALWLEQNQDAGKFFLTVESFDPHQPWLIPPHYRQMYLDQDAPEQILTGYGDVSGWDPKLVASTQANYSGNVTLCDRWFGFLMESLRVLGLLDNTMVIFTADHGHSVCDRGLLCKRHYPSYPETFDVPLIVRFPGAAHAGAVSSNFVQHHDITAAILDAAGVEPPQPIDGKSFLKQAIDGGPGPRDHVTAAWSVAITVITDKWWFNCKVDGTGALLYDLDTQGDPFAVSVAGEHPDVSNRLFNQALEDAGGSFPDWLIERAKKMPDLPGSSSCVTGERTNHQEGGIKT